MTDTRRKPVVGRTAVACTACRKGKRKCDGLRPLCSECRRHARDCVFVDQPTLKNKRPTKDYVESLEEQVKYLTTLINKHDNGHGLSDPRYSPHPHLNTNITNDNLSLSEQAQLPCQEESAAKELSAMQWKWIYDVNGSPTFIGPTSLLICSPHPADASMRISKALNDLTSLRQFDYSLLHNSSIFTYFYDLFLKFVNPYYHFIGAALSPPPPRFDGSNPEFQAYYSAVLSMGTCLVDDHGAFEIGESLAAEAEELVMSCYHTSPTTHLVQGLSILALRDLSLGRPGGGWRYLTLAASLVVHLGIHVLGIQKLSKDDQEVGLLHKLRTFWSFYFVDRLAVAVLGRSALRLCQPVYVPAFDTAMSILSTEESFCNLLHQLWYLHDFHMKNMATNEFFSIEEMEKHRMLMTARTALFEFYSAKLQNFLSRNTQESADIRTIILRVSYDVSLISIHRPFLVSASEESKKLSYQATNIAACSISRTIRLARKFSTLAKAPPFFIYHLLRAAQSHLLSCTMANVNVPKRTSAPLEQCLLALNDMTSTWPMRAQQAINVIRELACRWRVTWALPMNLSGPIPLTSISMEGPQKVPSPADDISAMEWRVLDQLMDEPRCNETSFIAIDNRISLE